MNWFGFELSSFLLVFIVLNIINVVIQTIKSIATVKWGAWAAATTNAIAYALYTIVVIYMNADGLGIVWKAVIIGLANLIGVYAVKKIEDKKRKDKLWAIRFTVKDNEREKIINELEDKNISYGYDVRGRYIVFETFCNSKKETLKVEEIVKKFNAKYFVSENKIVF